MFKRFLIGSFVHFTQRIKVASNNNSHYKVCNPTAEPDIYIGIYMYMYSIVLKSGNKTYISDHLSSSVLLTGSSTV